MLDEEIREEANEEGLDNKINILEVKFLKYLLENNFLTETKYPVKGCVVLYYDKNDSVKYRGILEEEVGEDEQLESGKWGHLLSTKVHKKYQPQYIPSFYDGKVKYYSKPTHEEVERYFEEFKTGPLKEEKQEYEPNNEWKGEDEWFFAI